MNKNAKIVLGAVGGLIVLFILLLALVSIIGSGTIINGGIAVIPVYGEIGYSTSDLTTNGLTNPDQIKSLIQQANEDSSINAIVLDINSPGGTPVASEELMDAIKNSKKPVVSWISDTGTSGAYLAASASDKIVASPSSWVGSIGVILDLTDLSEMYRQMGVNKYAIKGGKYKDMGADYRNLTTEERNMLQTMINEEYDYFITLVAQNRNLNKNYVKSIAEGKIYTGRQARKNKLVDYLGGKDKALDVAAQLAGITGSYNVIPLNPPSSFEQLLSSISSKIAYSMGMGNNMENSSISAISN